MQIRILLLIDDAPLRARVQRILRDVDAFVRVPKGDRMVWETAEQVPLFFAQE